MVEVSSASGEQESDRRQRSCGSFCVTHSVPCSQLLGGLTLDACFVLFSSDKGDECNPDGLHMQAKSTYVWARPAGHRCSIWCSIAKMLLITEKVLFKGQKTKMWETK